MLPGKRKINAQYALLHVNNVLKLEKPYFPLLNAVNFTYYCEHRDKCFVSELVIQIQRREHRCESIMLRLQHFVDYKEGILSIYSSILNNYVKAYWVCISLMVIYLSNIAPPFGKFLNSNLNLMISASFVLPVSLISSQPEQ